MKNSKEELELFEDYLVSEGFRKYSQKHKSSDYQWFKSMDITYDEWGDKNIGYLLAVYVYDYGKHNMPNISGYGVSFEMRTDIGKQEEPFEVSFNPRKLSKASFKRFKTLTKSIYTQVKQKSLS